MKPNTTPAPTPTPAAAPSSTTIGGHAVQVLAFIPDNTKDMRAQSRILELLADIKDGNKTIADLAPHLKNIEVKASYTRKRFTLAEAAELFAEKKPEVPEPETAAEAIERLTAAGAASPESEARMTWPGLFPED